GPVPSPSIKPTFGFDGTSILPRASRVIHSPVNPVSSISSLSLLESQKHPLSGRFRTGRPKAPFFIFGAHLIGLFDQNSTERKQPFTAHFRGDRFRHPDKRLGL